MKQFKEYQRDDTNKKMAAMMRNYRAIYGLNDAQPNEQQTARMIKTLSCLNRIETTQINLTTESQPEEKRTKIKYD